MSSCPVSIPVWGLGRCVNQGELCSSIATRRPGTCFQQCHEASMRASMGTCSFPYPSSIANIPSSIATHHSNDMIQLELRRRLHGRWVNRGELDSSIARRHSTTCFQQYHKASMRASMGTCRKHASSSFANPPFIFRHSSFNGMLAPLGLESSPMTT